MNKNLLIKFIIGVLFVIFYQIIIAPRTSILGAYADTALILTVWVALDLGAKNGIIFGFAAGSLIGLLTPIELGWSALLLSLIAYLTGSVKHKLVVEPMPAKILVLLVALLLYNMAYIFFTRFELFLINFEFVLTSVAYSTINSLIVGIILFIMLRYRYLLRNLI
jgi:rod shape-determining protein MreD